MKAPKSSRPRLPYHGVFTRGNPQLEKFFAKLEVSRLIRGRSDVCIRNLLFALTLNCRPQNILEIGSHIGAGTLVLAEACRINQAGKVFTLEPNIIFYQELKKNIARTGLGKFIIPIKGFSDDEKVRRRLAKKSFQLIFIDGRHNYRSVKSELNFYFRLLAPNAFIVLHDSSLEAVALDKEKLGGVRRAIIEFCHKHKKVKPVFFEPPLWGNAQGACLLCKQGQLKLAAK